MKKSSKQISASQPSKLPAADGEYCDIYGMRVRFLRGNDAGDGKPFAVGVSAPWDERLRLAYEFAATGAEAIVPNALGSWYRSLAALKVAGVRQATIIIPHHNNFLVSPERTAVIVNEVRAIFLPIYKSGTSSFRALAHAHFAEFSDRDVMNSTSLSSAIDPRDPIFAAYKKFTFIREPMQRFGSFFRDKLMVAEGSPNHETFANPIAILMDRHLDAKTAAEFITSMPQEFCDPHYKPQWLTLTFKNEVLADYIFRLGDNESLKKVGIDHTFVKRLSTDTRRSDYALDQTLSDAESLIRNYYRRDYRMWRDSAAAKRNVA
tara:strand:- start:1386 stop:2345 length:960 start_codon:yes stop_codon:yes gene_type:complete